MATPLCLRSIGLGLAVSVALPLAAGCGDDGTALEGIYELKTWTQNSESCDMEGPPSFQLEYSTHLFIRQDSFFGAEFVTAVDCASLEECREKASDEDTLYLGNFTFDSGGNDDDGWRGETGFLGADSCDGTVYEMLLTGEVGVSFLIESRGKTVTGGPRDDEGDCDLEGAIDQVADQPCEELEVVTGDFLESL